MDDPLPIARLLAMAYRSLVDDLHGRLRDQGWDDVRPAFGFVLLAARVEPTSAGELALLMGTTKQAAAKLVGVMEDAGYLERSVSGTDGRRRRIALSARGRHLLSAVEAIYADLEAGWAATIGPEGVERLRTDLTAVMLARGGGALPAVRPTW
jgi:DNA-binding MarR family transcriptional regulator